MQYAESAQPEQPHPPDDPARVLAWQEQGAILARLLVDIILRNPALCQLIVVWPSLSKTEQAEILHRCGASLP